MDKSPDRPKKQRRRTKFTFEVQIVPLDAYPDLKINPMNSWTESSDEERLKGVVEGLAAIIIDSKKAA